MTGRHQMRSLGRAGAADTPGSDSGAADDTAAAAALGVEAEPLALEESWMDGGAAAEVAVGAGDEPETALAPPRSGWLAPALASLALAGWSALFAYANYTALASGEGVSPVQVSRWVIDWSAPVILIGIAWLLAMRSSHAEAQRFASAAAAMRRESAALEARLTVVNRELSLAREFLAAQSRDLEALGRIAAERISTHAFELQSLIVSNGAQVEAIGSASETALGNMSRLRDDLPVIANAARDVANQVGGAGRTAQEQLDRLVTGFERLGAAGTTSDAQVAALAARVAEALDRFEQQSAEIDTAHAARLARLEQDTATLRTALAAEESAALEAMRAQLDKLTTEAARFGAHLAERDRAFHEEIERRQAAFETREAQASEVLAQRLAELDDNLAQRREAQVADTERLVAQGEALAGRLDELREALSEVAAEGESARGRLAAGLGDVSTALAHKRALLGEIESQLARLTEASGHLAEAIAASARTSSEEWPAAIAAATAGLEEAGARAGAIEAFMLSASSKSSDLSTHLAAAKGQVEATDDALAQLHQQLAERAAFAAESLAAMRAEAERLTAATTTLAAGTEQQLAVAVAGLEAAVAEALATLDAGLREASGTLATSIGSEAAQTIEQALRREATAVLGEIEQAAANASDTGRETTRQLRDQLARVNELTGNLEQRVARARELAEDQINNDFSRRAALITDSLNSAAIDLTTALATEVADTAWDAYLKGDRGIFTRRVVRLIDHGTARDIVELYQQDEGFKANVNRFVHDFEAMLRAMLSTRDGHALSITMLGSDLGKLYVALAQAIQRLRG